MIRAAATISIIFFAFTCTAFSVSYHASEGGGVTWAKLIIFDA